MSTFKMKMGRIPKDQVIAITIVVVLCLLTAIGFLLYRSGANDEGEANSSCERFPLPLIAGSSGWVISGHMTGCSPPAASVASYVYVHPKDRNESIEFMVFRYWDSYRGDNITYKWIDARTVSISLRSVGQITRLRKSVGPIRIVYEIGSEEYPRSE